ncbi:MAG: galactose mutarotase, partial [Sediminibacterium sp.]|nr:galactose mutarotase [Sediminibacterium sp.]
MKKQAFLLLTTGFFFLAACNNNKPTDESAMKPGITEKPFGVFENEAVTQYTLTNANGMKVSIINYGGTVTNLMTPDKDKHMGDVVLGFDSLGGYLQKGNP